MKTGEFYIAPDEMVATIISDNCNREFALLNVIRSEDSEQDMAVDQQECDYCPYCGKGMNPMEGAG